MPTPRIKHRCDNNTNDYTSKYTTSTRSLHSQKHDHGIASSSFRQVRGLSAPNGLETRHMLTPGFSRSFWCFVHPKLPFVS